MKLDCEIFNPDDAYDDDYQLIEGRVRIHIAMLVGSIPNATPGNPEAYIGMMVEEVMTEDISLPALESACSQIRRRVKFTPSISEVIEAIQEQAELWEPRLNAIHGCEDYATWLRDKLRIATELVAAEQVKREEQRLAAEEKKRVDASCAHSRSALAIACAGATTNLSTRPSWARSQSSGNIATV